MIDWASARVKWNGLMTNRRARARELDFGL